MKWTSHTRSYRRAVEEGKVYLTDLGEECTMTHVLQLLVKLKQICNRDPETLDSAKLDWLRENLEQMTSPL